MKRLLVILILHVVSAYGHAEGLRLYTETFKPYQYLDQNQEVAGFGTELVLSVFERAKVDLGDKVRLGVWADIYKRTLAESDSGIFMTVRNTQREDLFNWVGPLEPRTMWLYKLSERTDIQADTLEDAKQYLVGTYISAQSDYLEELGFPKLDIILKEELNIKKLLAGRVELIPSTEIMMASKMRDLELPMSIVEKVVVLDDRYQWYLALNKEIPAETVSKLQKALDDMKSDGSYHALRSKYIGDAQNFASKH